MASPKQAQLQFFGVSILNLSFVTNESETVLGKPAQNLQTTMNVHAVLKKSGDFSVPDGHIPFSIEQHIFLSSEGYFQLSVKALGRFSLEEGVLGDIAKNLMRFNAPAIMFPFVRAFIHTVVQNSGLISGLQIPAIVIEAAEEAEPKED